MINSQLLPKIPFTRDAFERMQQRRLALQQKRVEVIGRLKEAREQGDLSENGAYKYAKFELGDIGRELRKLNHLLANGQIQEAKASTSTVGFGNTVTVEADEGQLSFMLVSEHESNPAKKKLSAVSPLGSAVNGKRAGEEVVAVTPNGSKKYRIVSIS